MVVPFILLQSNIGFLHECRRLTYLHNSLRANGDDAKKHNSGVGLYSRRCWHIQTLTQGSNRVEKHTPIPTWRFLEVPTLQ